MKFTPSPVAQVRLVDSTGKTVKVVSMNRAKRRRLKIKTQRVSRELVK